MSNKPKDSLEPRKLPDVSPRILFLSKDKLESIKHISLPKKEREAKENAEKLKEQEKRKKLQEEAKSFVDTWPNSVAGLLRGEKTAAKLLEEEIEEERRTADAKEANYQKMRLDYLRDLNARRLYEQTDRVKGLHSLRIKAEAIKENDLLRLSHNHGLLFKDYDDGLIRNIMDDDDNFYEEDLERKIENRRFNKTYAAELDKQREDNKKKRENVKMKEFRTTLLLGDLGMENKDEDVLETKTEKDRHLHLVQEQKELDQKRSHFAAVQLKLEEKEDERRRLFLEAKEKMKTTGIAMKLEHKLRKDRWLEAVAKKLEKTRDNFNGVEELQREELAMKEMLKKQEEDDRLEQEQEEKKKKTFEEINRYREQTIQDKEMKRLDAISKQVSEYLKMKEDYKDYVKEEIEKQQQKLKSDKEYQHDLMHQIANTKLGRLGKKREAIEEYEQHISNLRQSEETFQSYAKDMIEDFEAAGLNTYDLKKASKPGIGGGTGPLLKERGGLKPTYLSAGIDNPAQLSSIPRKREDVDTKARLGFVS